MTTQRDRPAEIREGLKAFGDLVVAGAEIIAGQISRTSERQTFRGRDTRDVSISREAGELLFDLGVVGSIDAGILVFHERIGRDKPALRRTLARIDRAAGRLPKVKRTKAQKAYTEAIKGGLVVRSKETGRILRLTPKGKQAVRKASFNEAKRKQRLRQQRQRSALAKLQGFAQRGK